MPLLGVPLYLSGPRNDCEIGYLKYEVGAAGAVTVVAGQTTAGFSIAAFASGVSALTHPKCKFIIPLVKEVRPATLATTTEYRFINFADDWDPTTGTVAFNAANAADAVVTTPVDGSEVIMAFLYGF